MNKGLIGLLLLLFASITYAVDEQATVFINTDLKHSPSYSATKVQSLSKGQKVTIQSRKGIWLKVQLTDNQKVKGWLRRFDVRKDNRLKSAKKSSSGSSGVSNLFGNLFGSRNNNSNVTSTIGIRGLDAEEVSIAQKKVDISGLASVRSTPASARKTAQAAGLNAQDVEYIGEQSSGGLFDAW